MAAGDTTITICGNLTADPELRFAANGNAVANFTVASTPRYFDKESGGYKDGDTLFLRCNVWRQQAENVAESLQRGARVVVQGRLKQRSYETREGEKRTVYEIEADDVAVSLKNATAKVAKAQRQGSGGGFGQDQNPQQSGGFGQQGQGQGQQGGGSGGQSEDPWATGGGGGGFSEDPPF